jgi:Uncharacterized protein conserved in bacteria (DUF2237)
MLRDDRRAHVGGLLAPATCARRGATNRVRQPMTEFYRDGCCDTGPEDVGSHTVCAVAPTGSQASRAKPRPGGPESSRCVQELPSHSQVSPPKASPLGPLPAPPNMTMRLRLWSVLIACDRRGDAPESSSCVQFSFFHSQVSTIKRQLAPRAFHHAAGSSEQDDSFSDEIIGESMHITWRRTRISYLDPIFAIPLPCIV